MLNTVNLSKHFSLTSADAIEQICKPLFERLEINYFAYHRVFKDGTITRLSNYPEWSEHYIHQGYFNFVRIDMLPFMTGKYRYILWNHYLEYDPTACVVLQDSCLNFGIHNGFTILKNHLDYSEQFTFAQRSSKRTFNDGIYLNQIESIEKFTDYFLQQAAPLILQANENRFQSKNYRSKSSLKSRDRKYFINMNREIQGFSAREIDCLSRVVKGFTAKRIGLDLGISYRTAEEHISNLRRKFDCHSTQEIVNYIRHCQPLFHYLIQRN